MVHQCAGLRRVAYCIAIAPQFSHNFSLLDLTPQTTAHSPTSPAATLTPLKMDPPSPTRTTPQQLPLQLCQRRTNTDTNNGDPRWGAQKAKIKLPQKAEIK